MKKLYELSGIVLGLILILTATGCSKEEGETPSENSTRTKNVESVTEAEEGYPSKVDITMFGHVLGETKNEEIGSLSSSMRRTEDVQESEGGIIAYDYTGTKVTPHMQSSTRLMFYNDLLISFMLVFNLENEKIDGTDLADVFVEKLRPQGEIVRKMQNSARIDIIDCGSVAFQIKATSGYVVVTAMHMDGIAYLKKTDSEFRFR